MYLALLMGARKRKVVNTHECYRRARNRASDHAMGFHVPVDRLVHGCVLPVSFRKVMLNGAGCGLKRNTQKHRKGKTWEKFSRGFIVVAS